VVPDVTDEGREPVSTEGGGVDDWLSERQATRRASRDGRRRRADIQAELVTEHLDLVDQVVNQVASRFPRHVDREDLARAGTVGLVEAARRYDPDRAIPFPRFAARRIRGAILDAVRSADWAPRSVRVRARAVERAESELADRLHRHPTTRETAAHLGVPEREVDLVRERVVRAALLGLDVPLTGEDGPVTIGETVPDGSATGPCDELERRELHAYVRHAVAHLPERHREVVIGYFVQQRSSEDIARTLGVTVSRVSQLRSEALAAMRRGIEAQFVDLDELSAPATLVERRRAAYADAIGRAASCPERIADPGDPVTDEQFLAIVAAL